MRFTRQKDIVRRSRVTASSWDPESNEDNQSSGARFPSLSEIWRDLLTGFDQAFHGRGRFFEHSAFRAIELDFDDAPSTYRIYMNTSRPALADVRVRQAIAWEMPYETLLKSVWQGYARPINSIFPTGMPTSLNTWPDVLTRRANSP